MIPKMIFENVIFLETKPILWNTYSGYSRKCYHPNCSTHVIRMRALYLGHTGSVMSPAQVWPRVDNIPGTTSENNNKATGKQRQKHGFLWKSREGSLSSNHCARKHNILSWSAEYYSLYEMCTILPSWIFPEISPEFQFFFETLLILPHFLERRIIPIYRHGCQIVSTRYAV